MTKAKAAADAIGANLMIPKFRDDETGTDYNDWINNRLTREGE